MPGILYHLSFAEEVYRNLAPTVPIDKIAFMAGNLIPDLATDKQKSHYRKKASIEGFFVPALALAKKELFDPKDPVKFGMYCHLYLDYYFIEDFLIPEFIWDAKNNKVTNPRNSKQWDTETFFSHSGMYGSYTEINQLLVRDGHVSMDTISKIPEILPDTDLTVFDMRREKTWKTELYEYLAQKKEYTGDVFDYTRLCNYIKYIANQFVKEFNDSQPTIDRTVESCTCCGDVIRLLECKGTFPYSHRNFALYKTPVYNASNQWCYYLLLENDPLPIVICENLANSIIENPMRGSELAYSFWFDRYR